MRAGSAAVGRQTIARQQAHRIAADPDALAAYEVGLIDLPEAVETALEAMFMRSRRDNHSADDVNLLRGDE
jgi:hypothetical protein